MTSIAFYLLVTVLVTGVAFLLWRNWDQLEVLTNIETSLKISVAILVFFFSVCFVLINLRTGHLAKPRTVANAATIVSLLQSVVQGGETPSVWVCYQPLMDDEAKSFAAQIAELFRASGWEVNDNAPALATEGPFNGVRIIAYEGPFDSSFTQQHSDRKKALIRSIELLGERCQCFPNKGRDNRDMGALVIGPRTAHFPVDSIKCEMMPSEEGRF